MWKVPQTIVRFVNALELLVVATSRSETGLRKCIHFSKLMTGWYKKSHSTDYVSPTGYLKKARCKVWLQFELKCLSASWLQMTFDLS